MTDDSHPAPAPYSMVIPAAGRGTRMKTSTRKPHLRLGDSTILEHTTRQVRRARGVAETIVVLHPDDVADMDADERAATRDRLGVDRIVAGGRRRQDSALAGLQATDPELDVVLLHDGARPLVEPDLIEKVARRARQVGGAIAAVPATATVKEIDEEHRIRRTPDRDSIWLAQTPQGFRRDLLLEAYRRAEEDGFCGTDDAQLVERMGEPVEVVRDSTCNIKITRPRDLPVAEALMEWKSRRPART